MKAHFVVMVEVNVEKKLTAKTIKEISKWLIGNLNVDDAAIESAPDSISIKRKWPIKAVESHNVKGKGKITLLQD